MSGWERRAAEQAGRRSGVGRLRISCADPETRIAKARFYRNAIVQT
jgi:hypothetical protein